MRSYPANQDTHLFMGHGFKPMYFVMGGVFLIFFFALFASGVSFVLAGPDEEALRKASFTRNVAQIEKLLKLGVNPNTIVDPVLQWTSLHLASYFGDLEVVRVLLENGADLEVKTKTQQTPLYMASEQGHMDVLRLLIRAGADVNSKSRLGRTALYMAFSNQHRDVSSLLLDHGADVNTTTKDGWTAIMRASFEGQKDVVEALLALGAQLMNKDFDGKTALDYAREGKHEEIIVLLEMVGNSK